MVSRGKRREVERKRGREKEETEISTSKNRKGGVIGRVEVKVSRKINNSTD